MHNNRSPVPRFYCPSVFKLLQTPFSANLFFSHPCKTLGVWSSTGPASVPSRLVFVPACVFSKSQPLFFSLASFCARVPLFSEACSLFCENTRGMGGSARARTQRWARSQRAWAHAEAWA